MTRVLRPEERRRFGRIHFDKPVPARLGDARVNILDLALGGARVASEARFSPGAMLELNFACEFGEVNATCRVVRCTLAQFARAPGEKSLYQTGLQTVEIVGDSDHTLRQMIGTQVMRALEEQIANARGIPPIESLLQVQEETDRFRRCELTEGKWRRIETRSADQPPSGFTVAANVPIHSVDLLCETYQRADEEGRRLTKTLAQLSIAKGEGVPLRRYIP